MANIQPHRIKTINEFHQLRGLPKPAHPLISVVNLETIRIPMKINRQAGYWIFIPSLLNDV